jgi:hypothetical protein
MEAVIKDIRFALRIYRKHPGFFVAVRRRGDEHRGDGRRALSIGAGIIHGSPGAGLASQEGRSQSSFARLTQLKIRTSYEMRA